MQPRKLQTSKQGGLSCINIPCERNDDKRKQFLDILPQSLPTEGLTGNVNEAWKPLRSVTYHSAVIIFGKGRARRKGWLETFSGEMEPAIEGKNAADLMHNINQNAQTLHNMRLAS